MREQRPSSCCALGPAGLPRGPLPPRVTPPKAHERVGEKRGREWATAGPGLPRGRFPPTQEQPRGPGHRRPGTPEGPGPCGLSLRPPRRLFLVIEYVNGGDLMFHMQRQRKLPEEHARWAGPGQVGGARTGGRGQRGRVGGARAARWEGLGGPGG